MVSFFEKIVDDLLITGEASVVSSFEKTFDNKIKLGTVASGPGVLNFFGIVIEQNHDYLVTIHADDQLRASDCFPLSRLRRCQLEFSLIRAEMSLFMSIYSSIEWHGTAASPLRAFYASRLQQKLPSAYLKLLVDQAKYLRLLKSYENLLRFASNLEYFMSSVLVLMDLDAGRQVGHSHLSYYAENSIGLMSKESPFYTLSWANKRSKQPVRSTDAAEVLSASEAIDKEKMLKRAFPTLFGEQNSLSKAVDS